MVIIVLWDAFIVLNYIFVTFTRTRTGSSFTLYIYLVLFLKSDVLPSEFKIIYISFRVRF